MSTHLCITVRWITERFHSFVDGTEVSEWPPSPFRLFQALLAGAHRFGLNDSLNAALLWLEERPIPPDIIALLEPSRGIVFDHYVPDNDNSMSHRRSGIRKSQPFLLEGNPVVHYLWQIDPDEQPPLEALDELTSTLGWFGWAIDQAYAIVQLTDSTAFDQKQLARFTPGLKATSELHSLRVPKQGSIKDLNRVHSCNSTIMSNQSQRQRKKWPKVFDRVFYSNTNKPIARPYVVFRLLNDDDSPFRYPQSRLIHIAGMVRHLAIELMKKCPPAELPEGFSDPEKWVRAYVAGHQDKEDKEKGMPHQQFSYLPLPSIGHQHTDPSVRRVMITAPLGHDWLLQHMARLLACQRLRPSGITNLDNPPTLIPVDVPRKDAVAYYYTRESTKWASVTPVILPGHDDHKPEKTCKLIEKALRQSGIEQPCTFEWNTVSYFPKSLTAHKYIKDGDNKRQIGYIRPSHLLDNTAVHLILRFNNGVKMPGPLAIGAGRHCGLGLFAAVDDAE
jgi:CRISPR-associated protein Csb2